MKKEAILILDFGSQYTHLIKTRLFDLSVYSIIEAGDISLVEFTQNNPEINIRGIILSGGAQSVYDNIINFDSCWLNLNVPVLGICYGHQLLADKLGGKVKESKSEYGWEELTIVEAKSALFKNVSKVSTIWMSHRDTVIELPKGFMLTAKTNSSTNTAIENPTKKYFGVQFHPEVSHTTEGTKILENFAIGICQIPRSEGWSPAIFINETEKKYKKLVGSKKIVFGLSGGVDSMTMAAILRRIFPKDQLRAIYIDTGLMPDITMSQVKQFCEAQDIPLIIKNSSVLFFERLKGATNPTRKGKIIGRVFIREFEKIAKKYNSDFFAQGTIWSDVIESGVTKFSSQIKPHHNVGGLPSKLNFTLLEPLRELFKDKVRELAKYMELPDRVVNMKVFPGPGFAIRVEGVVNRKDVSLVRKCTKIIEEVIYGSEINNDIWMAFAILVKVPSLGVKGDKRVENKNAIVVRIVESTNSMTVNFSQKAFPYLKDISTRIVNETSIGRVVYDITNKPPATIEWQ